MLEDRHVASLAEQNANMIVASFRPVVFLELVAKTACLDADNGIHSGVEGFATVENF